MEMPLRSPGSEQLAIGGERQSMDGVFVPGQCVQMLSADLLTYWRVLPAYFCVLALATRDGQ